MILKNAFELKNKNCVKLRIFSIQTFFVSFQYLSNIEILTISLKIEMFEEKNINKYDF